jgi:hypothetical protein
MSPRIRLLREILVKFGEIKPVSPELAQKLRRYARPPPVRWPTPEERDPNRGPTARPATPTLRTGIGL